MEEIVRETALSHPCKHVRPAAVDVDSELVNNESENCELRQSNSGEDVSLSILITQCIQNDFLSLLSPSDSLPNRLHVGHAEAERIIGRYPESGIGPLSQIMQWARSQPEEELLVLHIRDFHDEKDVVQEQHLSKFGPHCLAHTEGAQLVLGLEKDMRANERFIDCCRGAGLNDCHDTNLRQHIEEAKNRIKGNGKLRVGVIGVWTELKVSFLLYDLKTVLGISDLATCSALTAGGSRSMHFYALNLIQTSLDVRVFDSVGDFAEWLSPTEQQLTLPDLSSLSCPLSIECEDEDTCLDDMSEEDHNILCYLFRNHSRIKMCKLAGGFSGAAVFRVKGEDAAGNRRPLSILKLGPRKLIAKERVNFERVQEVMGNHAPSILGFADFKDRSGIKFAYAAMTQRGDPVTFRSLYNSGASLKLIKRVLGDLFEEVLGPMYAAAQAERLCLLDYYDFNGKGWSWAQGGTDTPSKVKERVANLLEIKDGGVETLKFPGGFSYRNIAAFLEHDLPGYPRRATEQNLVSFQHGDLNGGNIVIDDNKNVWVIDFADTGRGHVLKDIAKLEAEVTWAWTKIENEDELVEVLAMTKILVEVRDLGLPLPEKVPELHSPHIIRAYDTVRELRRLAATIVKINRTPLQMSVVQLRYALHILCFSHIPRLQKLWALAAACGYGQCVKKKLEDREGPLRVHWVPFYDAPQIKGKIGITIIPGRGWRDLGQDVDRLKELGTRRLVCLCSEDELYGAASTKLQDALLKAGIAYYHFPVFPGVPPALEKAKEIVAYIGEGLMAGEDVVIVSYAGLGRCGVIAACCLVEYASMKPEDAIELVRTVRGNSRAIIRERQAAFVHQWSRRASGGNLGLSAPVKSNPRAANATTIEPTPPSQTPPVQSPHTRGSNDNPRASAPAVVQTALW